MFFFAGNIGKAQALETVIDGAEILMKNSSGFGFVINRWGYRIKKN